MVLCTGEHALLTLFEALCCYKLQTNATVDQLPWLLVFAPIFALSLLSVVVAVWAIRNDKSFEVHLLMSSIKYLVLFLLICQGYKVCVLALLIAYFLFKILYECWWKHVMKQFFSWSFSFPLTLCSLFLSLSNWTAYWIGTGRSYSFHYGLFCRWASSV